MRLMVDLPAPDGPTTASVLPAGTVKVTALQHDAFGIVAEHDILEADLAAAHDQRLGARPVLDLLRPVEQAEHRLHIDQPLRDLAIDRAEKVEGLVKLDQDRVGRDERADTDLAPYRDADGGQRPAPRPAPAP